ncbi:2-amino-4-hydroxy-6-hydroxymethyldihydropteridine diphosphokinase [Candidatus Chloroploca sp. M-50]|uniref:2-amino-4-hydroxy-6-hydroxymethyldihydropteridine diphosphokinase n=1 Tax=Candidatus Chloroploca mongolica TaxID=2528176 RepID=A0ABS4DHC8_9CHLR|nr:2-amino-4-hydroxy-6-hydroxymethyldihydropteridine diphosphokinase [Candidatus Chloroploca mongolica]MBP1468856.1 2-amino-4-hydroxy-6-hydroxymethyldihydropteridine diphosphokinase [Candidatus Chloroploca mongolica]
MTDHSFFPYTTYMRYFLGLGSNIAPHVHLPRMVQALLELAPTLHLGRVVETAPVGVIGDPFLNTVACIDLDLSALQLKQICNALETAFGRDRGAPGSKTKSRTADLDPLFGLAVGVLEVPADLLPHEPYTRPMLLELIAAIGMHTDAEQPDLAPGVSLPFHDLVIGAVPLTIVREGSRYHKA